MKSHSTIRYWICYLFLLAALLVLFVGTICTGSVSFSLAEIGSLLAHPEKNETAWKILWEIRMPRSLTAIILGGALSVSGFLLQTFFSNPIAGPYILGISSGAKLTVALAMIFFLGHGISTSCFLRTFAAMPQATYISSQNRGEGKEL